MDITSRKVLLFLSLFLLGACKLTEMQSTEEIFQCTFVGGGEAPLQSTVVLKSDRSIELIGSGKRRRAHYLTRSEFESLQSLFDAVVQPGGEAQALCQEPVPEASEEPSFILRVDGTECEYPWFEAPDAVRRFALRLGEISSKHFPRHFHESPSSWPSGF